MKHSPKSKPTTLGEALTPTKKPQQARNRVRGSNGVKNSNRVANHDQVRNKNGVRGRNRGWKWALFTLLILARLSVVFVGSFLTLWWVFVSTRTYDPVLLGTLVVLFVLWSLLHLSGVKSTATRPNAASQVPSPSRRKSRGSRQKATRQTRHMLLKGDRQGFMAKLVLSDKTVIIDGSNIYHFGHDHGVGRLALALLAGRLRSEGYRVVCFFDANIHFTLKDHKAIATDAKHTLLSLLEVFELMPDEVFIVPSGQQADRYILECLKYLPVSFAVSNDQYRDYAAQYPSVINSHSWRKGVFISDNELCLRQHSFKDRIGLRNLSSKP
jgi:hypothetical protein